MRSDNAQRSIGKAVSVAADRFVVELNRGGDSFTVVGFDDIHYVAALGSFVMLPVGSDYVVAEVVGLWEKDPTSGRAGTEGVALDKVASAKFLELVPVGMLPQSSSEGFRFGVSAYPALYVDALYALESELDRIFEVVDHEERVGADPTPTRLRAIEIGTSTVFKGYPVKAKVDELFGGHAAVLGNTGSGKSCTVATILQALFDKRDELAARGATFVILDVNGEYRSAFTKLPEIIKRSYLRVADDPTGIPPVPLDQLEATTDFRLPHWFMTVEEWELLLRASERTQQPVLRSALGLATLIHAAGPNAIAIKRHVVASAVKECFRSENAVAKGHRARTILDTFGDAKLGSHVLASFKYDDRFGNFPGANTEAFLAHMDTFLIADVRIPDYAGDPFDFAVLGECFEVALLYEEAHGNKQIRDYCSQMLTRFKRIASQKEYGFIRVRSDELRPYEKSLDLFVEKLIGLERRTDGLHKASQIAILDMNEAADEVVEVVSSVVTRLIFDRLRRADPRNTLPVHLVLEEAHRYVAERPSTHAIDSSRVFQRVAKEGRKYGAFLVLASQRPSEISKTVLSQCSNFVVHRIQNPDDLSHIRQMTPFISDSVMKRLPSLPKQHALIFGNAVNLPTTFRVRNVDPKPKSDDARIRHLWFRAADEPIAIALPSPPPPEGVSS